MIATVRSERDVAVAQRAGAHQVVRTGELTEGEAVEAIRSHAPKGIDHVVEVAFHANVRVDEELLGLNGSIAAYATDDPSQPIPFWQLVFKNVRVFFLGSDDFPAEAKMAAARGLNGALEAGWPGFEIGRSFALRSVAEAHETVEGHRETGRVVIWI